MVRKLSLVLALTAALSPLNSYALGVGGINTKSALNQNFDASIELFSVAPEELDQIEVTLASPEAYEKAGVERMFLLTKLQFEPVVLSNGKTAIKITSSEAINEPYLDFLIEVKWPKGRVLREFTVLLDPPVTLSRKPAPVRAATQTADQRPAAMPAQTAVDVEYEYNSAGVSSPGEYGPTQRNDTLWNIAKSVKPAGVTVEQMMMALLDANPQAFINGNVNNLKTGQILRVPGENEITGRSASEARGEFMAQVDSWRSSRGEPIAAVEEPAGEAAATVVASEERLVEVDGRLELVSVTQEATATDGAEGDQAASAAGTEALNDQLLMAREQYEAAQQENSELSSRVSDLEVQVNEYERLITLKEEKLAALQAQLAEREAALAAAEQMGETEAAVAVAATEAAEEAIAEEAVAVEVAEEATAAADAAMEAMDSTATEAMDTADDAGAMVDTAVGEGEAVEMVSEEMADAGETESMVDEAVTEEVVTEPAQTPESMMDAEEVIEVAEVETPVEVVEPLPLQEEADEPEAGILDDVSDNMTLIGIIVAGILVLLSLIWLVVSRRKSSDEDFEESILAPTEEESVDDDLAGIDHNEMDTQQTDETSFLSDFSPSDIDEVISEETGEVDPVSEADVYIAYGRYQQAEELVRQALEKEPERDELRFKLLEILYAAKETDKFVAEAEAASAVSVDQKDANAWQKIVSMGRELAPGSVLFGGDGQPVEAETPEETGFEGEPVVEIETDYAEEESEEDLSGVDLGELGKSDMETGSDDLDQMSELDLNIDLDTSSTFDLETTPDNVVDTASELDLDLDISLDGESQTTEPVGEMTAGAVNVEDTSGLDTDIPAEEEDIDDMDEINTKLDLARAYVDMGDMEGAREILQEVKNEGDDSQKQEAEEILGQIS